ARGMEVSGRRATPNSVPLRHLIAPNPHLRRAVEIVIERMARSRRGLDQVIHEWMHRTAVLHGEGAHESVIAWVAPLIALCLDEIGQQFSIRPTLSTVIGPAIKVLSVSSDVDHGV